MAISGYPDSAHEQPARSGFRGLSSTQIRARLLQNGWTTPLPIVAHDADRNGAGKAPAIRDWQRRAQFDGLETTNVDPKVWERKERHWPSTGIACGNVLAIDADFATDAALAEIVTTLAFEVFGNTPFLREGQTPKVALIYRAAEAMPSLHLKAADGSGDGIDILCQGTQFVAYGVHPKTLKPYAWIGAESPLTAGPDEAPEITQAQVDEFVYRLRGIVELNGTGGRKGQGGGTGGGKILRNADGRVIDGREYHLTHTVYSVALAMKAEGIEITAAELTSRAWKAFETSAVLDDARWSSEAARVKAVALLDRVRRGLAKLDPRPAEDRETIEPTYPDTRVSVAEAEAATDAIVTAFFREHVPAWRAEMAQWKTEADESKDHGQPEPAKPVPVSWGARIETAIGKTALAIKGAAEAATDGFSIIYVAPTHRLLSELAERFAAEGIEARVYRGYTNPDPDAPGELMCLDIPATEDAKAAVRPIPSTVCEKRVDDRRGKVFCRFHHCCGMERQRRAHAPVWLVPHALLFQARPGAIPAPDALVIDEGVTMGALPDKPARMSLDAIERAPVAPSYVTSIFTNAANDLDTARANFLRALRDHRDDGPLQRAILLRHGVTAAAAGSAYKLEWDRLRDPGITPGMDPKARKARAAEVGQHNQEVKLLAGIWRELRTFLAGDADASGRLSLRYDKETETCTLDRRSLDTVRSSWSAPALLIDATLPDAPLLEPVMGHRVEVKADITAKWSPHVKVRQILGAPVTARKLGIIETHKDEEVPAGSPKRVVTDLLRLICLRAALVWPRVVVVIAPKRLVELVADANLPGNVETAHFGAVAGIDRWASAAGLICIGRLQPPPGNVEPLAGVITGTVPQAIPPNSQGGGRWYPRVGGAVRLASGRGVRIECDQHPDSLAEALRWQITEAGLIQAIGRLRPLRRGPEAPAFLDVINDVPLPISVDATAVWSEAKVGAWAEMAAEGVLLTSAKDIMACFPEIAPTHDRAREVSLPTLGVTSIRDIFIDVTPSVRLASYKRLGRYAPARAVLLPNAPADLKCWLFDRLGAIEWVMVEEPEAAKEAKPPSAHASAPCWPHCADTAPELAAAYRLAVDEPARPTTPHVPVFSKVIHWLPSESAAFLRAAE